MAAKKKKVPASKRRSRQEDFSFPVKLIGISLILVVFIKHSFIFLIAGMLPSIVVAIVDNSRSRFLFKTVAAFNFSGVAPYMADLMLRNNTASAVQEMVGTPTVWLVMYVAAAIGWMMVKLAPALIKAVMTQFSDNKVTKIETDQKKLIEEWGPEVKGDIQH